MNSPKISICLDGLHFLQKFWQFSPREPTHVSDWPNRQFLQDFPEKKDNKPGQIPTMGICIIG
jgi:hypothetical protein